MDRVYKYVENSETSFILPLNTFSHDLMVIYVFGCNWPYAYRTQPNLLFCHHFNLKICFDVLSIFFFLFY